MHLLTIIRIFHLTGLMMGFGGAILLDLTIFKHGVLRPVSRYTIHQAELLSRVVTMGLISLWSTGIGLIAIGVMSNPDYLTNGKLWAKMVIVVLLTFNGVFVHNRVLPVLKEKIGSRLFEFSSIRDTALLTFVGSVSFVSWTTPLILGKATELNYVTPMWVILAAYCAAVIAAWAFSFTMMSSISKLQSFARKTADATLQRSEGWETMRTPHLNVARSP